MASIAVAAGTAATVVQLVDFAGRVLQSTTTFIAAFAGASKELDAIHRKIRQLEGVLNHTRALACSYQNTKLALSPQNENTLELLGDALTLCSVDLKSIQDEVQKPLKQSKNSFVRIKRRLKCVLDEQRLAKLSLRLDGDMAFINNLLGCLALNNDAITNETIQHISSFVEALPTVTDKLTELSLESSESFGRIESEFVKMLDGLDKIDSRLSMGVTTLDRQRSDIYNGANTLWPESSPATASYNQRSRLSPSIDGSSVLQSLELLGPVARKALAGFYHEQNVQISKKSFTWIMARLHGLLAEVHSAVSQAYLNNVLFDAVEERKGLSTIEIPKRFRHTAIMELHHSKKHPNVPDNSAASTAVPSTSGSYSDLHYMHHFSDPTGNFYSSIDGVHASSTQMPEFGRVAFSFVPNRKYNLPGVSFASCHMHREAEQCFDCLITAFDIIPSNAPIIHDVKSGDLGVSRVRRRLKDGEAWAGDRDDTGRSLLSYAIETKSRDMVVLLVGMGADPQDVHSMKELKFATLQNFLT